MIDVIQSFCTIISRASEVRLSDVMNVSYNDES